MIDAQRLGRTSRRARRIRPIPEKVFVDIVRVLDLVVLAVAAYIASYGGIEPSAPPGTSDYVAGTAVGILVWTVLSPATLRWSVSELRRPRALIKVALCWGAVIAVMFALALLIPQVGDAARHWLVRWLIVGLLSLLAFRIGTMGLLVGKGGRLVSRRVIVLGCGELGRRVADHLQAHCATGVNVTAALDDSRIAEAREIIQHMDVDCVVLALPFTAQARIKQLVEELRQVAVDVCLVTDTVGFNMRSDSVPNVAGIPVLVAAERPMKEWRAVVKAVEDKVLASIALCVFLPLLAFIAVAIKLDSRGPVLFRQPRRGFNQRIFHVYKFRTMYTEVTDELGNVLTARGDKRVTRVGAFLRKTSLDELPQLVNVLLGDMSVVGPRPHPLNAKAADKRYDEVVACYALRHRVKPGITGWAQVNGWRGQTDTFEQIERRVEYDLHYIENWSLGLDIWILFLTLWCGFYHRNAY